MRLGKAIGEVMAGSSNWPLYVYGGVGTGKTCAGLCMADHVRGAIYKHFEELTAQMLQASRGQLVYGETGHTAWPAQLWQEIEEAPLVVLDDVGLRERANDYQYDTFMRFLERRANTPYVVIANSDLVGLAEAYDYRIASRLSGATAISCDWPDMRPASRG